MKKMLSNLTLALASVIMLVGGGCARFKAATVPSDQKSAALVLTPESASVLIAAIQNNTKTLASSLESVPDNGSGFYNRNESYLIGPDGKPLTDKDGNPLKITCESITKVNNLQNFQSLDGISRAEYTLGGYDYVKDLPESMKQIITGMPPTFLKLVIEGNTKIGVKGATADNRDAAGRERTAIFAGMSAYAQAQGVAFAIKVESVTNGIATIATSAGTLIGQVIKTSPATITADLAKSGVTKLVDVVVRTADDKLVPVVAANAAADECVGCSQP